MRTLKHPHNAYSGMPDFVLNDRRMKMELKQYITPFGYFIVV